MRAELVTTLKRKATELLSEVERDKEPILITHHGLPSAYLVDAETFELQQERIGLLEALLVGERAISEGRTLTQEQVEKRLKRWPK
jgi:prevent-host-death family protein